MSKKSSTLKASNWMSYLPFIIVPAIVVLTAAIGSMITLTGMEWYNGITKPAWVPPGSFIGIVWTVIYTLCTAAILITWQSKITLPRRRLVMFLFLSNAALNIIWSFLFFGIHSISWSVAEMLILNISTILLIYLIWPFSKTAAALLIPYAAWVTFATYLAYTVLTLN